MLTPERCGTSPVRGVACFQAPVSLVLGGRQGRHVDTGVDVFLLPVVTHVNFLRLGQHIGGAGKGHKNHTSLVGQHQVAGLHPLLANCLRLTVGTADENRLMLAALQESL